MITIVSGLPRSGTSLMMQMLSAGGLPALTDRRRAADDDNPRGYFEFERVKKTAQDPGWLAEAEGKAVKVISQLLETLPADRDYRVVFMLREMGEILASQREMLRRLGREPAADDAALAAAFESHLAKVRGQIDRRSRTGVLYVSYNELVKDPAGCARRVNAFLGGGLDEAAMVSAVDPALYRKRASAPA